MQSMWINLVYSISIYWLFCGQLTDKFFRIGGWNQTGLAKANIGCEGLVNQWTGFEEFWISLERWICADANNQTRAKT